MQENQAKGMATHFSILALRIPWTEEPGGLQSMGLQRNRHNWGAKHEAWWTWAIFQSIGYLSGFSSISPFCYWTKVTLKIKLLVQPESRSSEKKPTCSLVYLKQHHQSIIRVLGDTSQPTAFPTTVHGWHNHWSMWQYPISWFILPCAGQRAWLKGKTLILAGVWDCLHLWNNPWWVIEKWHWWVPRVAWCLHLPRGCRYILEIQHKGREEGKKL